MGVVATSATTNMTPEGRTKKTITSPDLREIYTITRELSPTALPTQPAPTRLETPVYGTVKFLS